MDETGRQLKFGILMIRYSISQKIDVIISVECVADMKSKIKQKKNENVKQVEPQQYCRLVQEREQENERQRHGVKSLSARFALPMIR